MPPRQNPVSDIERFLMEVDRLRRQAADETQRGQRRRRDAEEVLDVQPAAEVRPAPVQRPPRQRPRKRQFDDVEVVDAGPAQQTGFPAPLAEQRGFTASPQASGLFPADSATVATIATIARPATIATVAAPQAAGQGSRRAANRAAEQARALLKSTNGRAAIILREILEPPLCKRRRR